MQRREFLSRSLATMLATGVAPLALTAREKSGTKPAVIGKGEHTYECDHHWGQLPSSIRWQTTHGTAVDAAGLVYITHQGYGKDVMDTVVVFDPKGKYVRSFGKEWHGGGHGIDIRKEGGEEFIYLSHMSGNGPVAKTTLEGKLIWKKGAPAEAKVYTNPGSYRPTNVAFATDGGYYVADGYGANYIHQFDKDDKWVRSWGGTGDKAGQMRTPHGIWLDNRPGRTPSIVVADRANARLQYFSLEGKHLGFVKEVLFPAHFDIRGEVLMVPDLHARVSLFDKENKALVHLGDDPEWRKKVLAGFKVRSQPADWKDGKFVHPHDACFDADGNIFVAEWVQTGRVSKLKKVS
ncbi:MAG: peptidase [Gemmataceae bacterium]